MNNCKGGFMSGATMSVPQTASVSAILGLFAPPTDVACFAVGPSQLSHVPAIVAATPPAGDGYCASALPPSFIVVDQGRGVVQFGPQNVWSVRRDPATASRAEPLPEGVAMIEEARTLGDLERSFGMRRLPEPVRASAQLVAPFGLDDADRDQNWGAGILAFFSALHCMGAHLSATYYRDDRGDRPDFWGPMRATFDDGDVRVTFISPSRFDWLYAGRRGGDARRIYYLRVLRGEIYMMAELVREEDRRRDDGYGILARRLEQRMAALTSIGASLVWEWKEPEGHECPNCTHRLRVHADVARVSALDPDFAVASAALLMDKEGYYLGATPEPFRPNA